LFSHSVSHSISESVSQAAGGETDLPRGKLQVNMAAHFANGMHATCNMSNIGIGSTTSSCMQHLPANKIKGKSQPITKITPTHTAHGKQQNG